MLLDIAKTAISAMMEKKAESTMKGRADAILQRIATRELLQQKEAKENKRRSTVRRSLPGGLSTKDLQTVAEASNEVSTVPDPKESTTSNFSRGNSR